MNGDATQFEVVAPLTHTVAYLLRYEYLLLNPGNLHLQMLYLSDTLYITLLIYFDGYIF